MKKIIILLLFIPLISCFDDGFVKVTELQTYGCFQSGDDMVIITKENLRFNDGIVLDIKRSDDEYDYFINAFFNGTELLATSIEYNSQTKEYRWTRFESGINIQIFKRIDCPKL